MEPLRKLRQDCTVPSLQSKAHHQHHQSLDASVAGKRLLSPEELRKQLMANHELECKSQLRTIASSLNGQAGLHAIRGEWDDAIRHYRSVLRWAADYTGAISVDSLLQVHALHNLLEVFELRPDRAEPPAERTAYAEQLAQLQAKYMSNCHKLVGTARSW